MGVWSHILPPTVSISNGIGDLIGIEFEKIPLGDHKHREKIKTRILIYHLLCLINIISSNDIYSSRIM